MVSYFLRAGQSGPAFKGNTGDVLTLLSDGSARFDPPSSAPLTAMGYVNPAAPPGGNGNILLPFQTIQQGLLAGATGLNLATGVYAPFVVPPGAPLFLFGEVFTSDVPSFDASAGSEVVAILCATNGCNFTDLGVGNLYATIICTESGPSINVGGGAYEAQNTEYEHPVTVTNVTQLVLDDFSERTLFASGATIASNVPGPILLQCNGANPSALVLVDRDETVAMTKRLVLGKSQFTANRAITVTPSATVGQILTIDSYNASGFVAAVKLAGATVFTIPSSAVRTRYRLRCTVANTTWTLDSQEQLS